MSNLVKYRSDIDGLRALAILSVFLFHLKSSWLSGGFVGVDIFFVISGFLITKILLREIEAEKFSFSGFYIRRIRRIFPALFLVLFVSFLIAIIVLGSVDLIWFSKTLKYASIQVSNILFQKKVQYFDTQFEITPLLHTWSLGVEEQFYLIFPLLLYFIFKGKRDRNHAFNILLILSIFSLILSQVLLFTTPKISFFSIISRFWELGIGGLLAFDKLKKPKDSLNEILGFVGLSLVISSILLTNEKHFPGIYALPACFGSALIIFSGQFNQTFISKILSNRLLVFFGLISYSLYLWHYPIIEFYKELYKSAEIPLNIAAIIFLFATFISYLSYKYIETPFRKIKSLSQEKTLNIFGKKIYRPFVISLGCIIFFVATTDLVRSWQKEEFKKIFGDSAQGKENSFNSDCIIDNKVDFSPDFIDKCVQGDRKKDFEVLLIGDSHAWRYSLGLLDWATKKNYSMAIIATTNCHSFIDNGENNICQDISTLINNAIEKNKNLKYVILAYRWDDAKLGEAFKEKLNRNIEFYKKHSKKVVIMGLVPIFKSDPVKCFSRNNAIIHKNTDWFEKEICGKHNRKETSPFDEFLSKFFLEMVAKHDVKYFDPKSHLCDEKFCYSKKDGKVLYTDINHLDFEGSYYVAKYFDF